MKKKICFILPGWITKQTGGAEWQLYKLSEKFLNEGWAVSVVTEKKSIIYPEYLNDKISYIYFKPKYFKFSFSFALCILFFKLFSTKSYFYYVRTDARIARSAVRFYTKFVKKKYIFALANDHDSTFTNLYDKAQFSSKYFLKNILSKLDLKTLDRLSSKIMEADLLIAQNDHQYDQLHKNKMVPSTISLTKISNSYFGSFCENTWTKKNVIIWVGNMRPVKRPEYFLQIVENLSKSSFHFQMIGNPRSYAYLINNFKQKNFTHVGEAKNKKVTKFFVNSKIIVNTSESEGFSNTFLEAWANKVWIITLGVDPDNIITKNGIGDVCKTIDEVVNKIKEIEINGLNEQKLQQAQDFVKQYYAFEQNFEFLLSELKKLN